MSEVTSQVSSSGNSASNSKLLRRNWKKMIVDAGLPSAITATLTSIIKSTRLWRREKSEIALELVAHFQDGIQSGRSADELQKSFGDAKQAAKLIRSAKIRCRPLWWQVWWYASRGFAIVVGVYLIAAIWQSFGRASIDTNYTALINQRAESWGENEKAWPIYREAFREFDFIHMPSWYENSDYNFTPSSENWPEIKKWLATKQHAIELMRKGSQLPGLGFSVYRRDSSYDPADQLVLGELNARNPEKVTKERTIESYKERPVIDLLIPHASTVRRALDFVRADALRAASENDGATSLANVTAILGMSRQIEEIPFCVNSMIACRYQNFAMQTICDILTDHPEVWNDDQLKELAHRVAAQTLHPEKGLDVGERIMMRDLVQRLYTDDGNGDGRITRDGIQSMRALIPRDNTNRSNNVFFVIPNSEDIQGNTWADKALENPLFQTLILPATNSISASRKEVLDRFDQWVSYEMTQLAQPLWLLDPDEPMWMKSMREDSQEQKKYWLVNIFANPDTVFPKRNFRGAVQRARGYRDGALIGLAMELYKRKEGSWPKTLADLAPKYLPSVPVDRFSGKPLAYKVIDNRPLVYSVGADGDDDSGALAKENKESWIEYHYDGSHEYQAVQSQKIDKSKLYNGDWVIWTMLPEHRKKPPVDEPKK